MERVLVMQSLGESQDELTRLGVRSLALFGSLARGEAGAESDIDLLVEFSLPVGLFAFLEVQFYLEKLLGRKVDLVTPDALRQSMKNQILAEALYVS
jgi:predicted nucleotidyltransferase